MTRRTPLERRVHAQLGNVASQAVAQAAGEPNERIPLVGSQNDIAVSENFPYLCGRESRFTDPRSRIESV